MSEAYLKRLMDAQFKSLSDKGWFSTLVLWLIDSDFKRYKAVDLFLADQLETAFFAEEYHQENKLLELAKKFRGKNPYMIVSQIEEFVIRNFFYKTDADNYGMDEYWASALETLKSSKGDCEDHNSLIYLLCRLAGIPASNLYCCVGHTSSQYHFWTLFYDSRRSRFVKLDATLYPKVSTIAKKPEFKLGGDYTTIDYIFNENGIWRFNG